jgi:hypothetical protein
MKKVRKEPLLHFLLLGVPPFVLDAWRNGHAREESAPRLVRISQDEVHLLKETWTRQRQREPSEEELRGLVTGYLREEVLAREAWEMGLEENDTIIRRLALARIQIIEGWLDEKGQAHEKTYDIVWSDADKRKPGPDGNLPPVGNTVGDPELITVWKDADLDANQRAFYYARVLEIQTPRWTACDAKRLGVKPLPGTTMTLQERAYASPIWYASESVK